jgi:hypothetical protein
MGQQIEQAVAAAPDLVAEAIAKAPYIAAAPPIYFGFTANEIGIYGGLIIAILTFLGNMYFKRVQTKIFHDSVRKLHRRDDIPDALEKLSAAAENLDDLG